MHSASDEANTTVNSVKEMSMIQNKRDNELSEIEGQQQKTKQQEYDYKHSHNSNSYNGNNGNSASNEYTRIKTAEPFRTFTVWAGEWPYVKRGIAEVRETLVSKTNEIAEKLQLQHKYNTLRHSSSVVDHFTTQKSFEVYNALQRHRWILPACGVLFLSGYVAIRSAPWGTYAMIRNGMLTTAVLTFMLFPHELLNSLDSISPFSSAPILPPSSHVEKVSSLPQTSSSPSPSSSAISYTKKKCLHQ